MAKFNPETLRFIRKSRKMTQAQLAEKCGVSRDMISHWERGKHTPAKRNLKKLETVLELADGDLCKPLDEFFNSFSADYCYSILESRMRSYEWADNKKDLKSQALANQITKLLLSELKPPHQSSEPVAPSEAQIIHENLLEAGEEPEWKNR